MSAGGIKPRHSYTIAYFHPFHARANVSDNSNSFMPGYEWRNRLHRPISARSVNIRATHAAGFHFDQYLPRPWSRDIQILDNERFAKLLDNRSLHLIFH
jgi:hypothetical protein